MGHAQAANSFYGNTNSLVCTAIYRTLTALWLDTPPGAFVPGGGGCGKRDCPLLHLDEDQVAGKRAATTSSTLSAYVRVTVVSRVCLFVYLLH